LSIRVYDTSNNWARTAQSFASSSFRRAVVRSGFARQIGHQLMRQIAERLADLLQGIGQMFVTKKLQERFHLIQCNRQR
jgi:HD-like signal output (HDOD) protein